MDRQYLANATSSAPSAPSTPSSGHPTDGNPSSGTPPTYPGAYWFHMICEEIRNVIVAAGLTPSASALNQLAEAIFTSPTFSGTPTAPTAATGMRSTQIATMQKFADEFPSAQSPNGWTKLPNGLILQWGDIITNSSGQAIITFPIMFPGALFRCIVNPIGDITNGYVVGKQVSQDNTSTVINIAISNNLFPAPAGVVVGWHAIGN